MAEVKAGGETRKRESNMELLRIVSMLLIITFHCALKSGFAFEDHFSVNKFMVKTLWMFGELGVNLFLLISGYFMVQGKFKWRKLILLLAEVSFYQTLAHFVALKLGIFQWGGLRDAFLRFFPVTLNWYWFMTAYVIIYLLTPYLNAFVYAMNQETYKKFLITVLALYSVMPTVFGVFYNSTETLLYYNRLIWLIVVYFIGAYVRLYHDPVTETMKASATVSAASFGMLAASILVIEKFSEFFSRLGTSEVAYFWPPNTVPMICLSIGVFGIFKNLKIGYRPWINKIASATLGIYLLHDSSLLASWIWGTMAQCANYYGSPFLVVRILGVSVIIFLMGMAIDWFRQMLEKYTLKKALDSERFAIMLRTVKGWGK